MDHQTVFLRQLLYRRPHGMFPRQLKQMKNTTDADDLFQEVFIRLVRHVQDLESWEHVKAWLIRVTINCAKKYYEQPAGIILADSYYTR